jgi:hypothetical protein
VERLNRGERAADVLAPVEVRVDHHDLAARRDHYDVRLVMSSLRWPLKSSVTSNAWIVAGVRARDRELARALLLRKLGEVLERVARHADHLRAGALEVVDLLGERLGLEIAARGVRLGKKYSTTGPLRSACCRLNGTACRRARLA